jgi:hypothetical protein
MPSLPLLLAAALLLVNQAPSSRKAPAGLLELSEPTPLASSEAYAVAPNCVPAWIIDTTGIRRLPDRCGAATAASAGTAALALVQEPASGVAPKKPRSTTPARATAAGAARKRAGQDCADPYWLDARGVRRLRPGCL